MMIHLSNLRVEATTVRRGTTSKVDVATKQRLVVAVVLFLGSETNNSKWSILITNVERNGTRCSESDLGAVTKIEVELVTERTRDGKSHAGSDLPGEQGTAATISIVRVRLSLRDTLRLSDCNRGCCRVVACELTSGITALHVIRCATGRISEGQGGDLINVRTVTNRARTSVRVVTVSS